MGRLKKKASDYWGERLRFQLRAAWDIFWEARRSFSLDGCMNLSAAIAFYSILSLIPFLFLLFVPHTAVALRHALAGGASCALLFEGVKHFFTWYIANDSQYGVVYGSLEAIVILVVWTFYSSSILLFCAEVVSAYRRRDVTLLEKAFL